MRRVAFEVETLAFFLSTLGLAVVATSAPENLYKEHALIAAGLGLYYLLGWFLRDLTRAVRSAGRSPCPASCCSGDARSDKTVLGAKN
jgi:hypothetical protein